MNDEAIAIMGATMNLQREFADRTMNEALLPQANLSFTSYMRENYPNIVVADYHVIIDDYQIQVVRK